MKDVLAHEDLSIGSYHFAVSRVIPQMTLIALRTHKKDMMKETPDFAKTKFLFRLSRSEYEKEWGKGYSKPDFGTRFWAVVLRYMPKRSSSGRRGLGQGLKPPLVRSGPSATQN